MEFDGTNPGLRSYSQEQMIIFTLWAVPLLSPGHQLPITATGNELSPKVV